MSRRLQNLFSLVTYFTTRRVTIIPSQLVHPPPTRDARSLKYQQNVEIAKISRATSFTSFRKKRSNPNFINFFTLKGPTGFGTRANDTVEEVGVATVVTSQFGQ